MAQASLVKWLYFSGAQDETGNPVSSGSAYFYIPHSTSVQTTVYADDAAATPLSQPVTLDSGGRAEVFITQNCEIKVLDAAGATKRLTISAESVTAKLVYCLYSAAPTTLDIALAAMESALGAIAAVVVPVDTAAVTTISTESPVFTFDATKPLNVFKASYAGAVGTLTVNWSGTSTQYARYRVVIQTGTTTTATATALPATFFTSSPPTTLAAHTSYTADFEASDTLHLTQVTPWVVVGNLSW